MKRDRDLSLVHSADVLERTAEKVQRTNAVPPRDAFEESLLGLLPDELLFHEVLWHVLTEAYADGNNYLNARHVARLALTCRHFAEFIWSSVREFRAPSGMADKALAKMTGLRTLALEANRIISDAGLASLRALTSLDLGWSNLISDAGLASLHGRE